MLMLPDDGLIPIGSLPVAIEDPPRCQLRKHSRARRTPRKLSGLESLRDTSEFAEFRQEVARRRAIMKRSVEAMREQLGLAAE
jgi:hypothetical protein